MIETKELIRWLKTLPADSGVSVVDGLVLACNADPDAYIEVGGEPDTADNDEAEKENKP